MTNVTCPLSVDEEGEPSIYEVPQKRGGEVGASPLITGHIKGLNGRPRQSP